MAHNLQQHARRILAHSSRTARFFSSYTNKNLWSSNQILQSRIESALDQKSDISRVLEQWRQQQGNQLNPSLVRGIVEKLRDSQRFHQALDVSDWMIERKICNLVPEDFTARFHLIENVLGLKEAEKFFENIPMNQRGESIYTALLDSYTKAGNIYRDKAESTFEKMRELGLLSKPSPYNSMISLYGSLRKRDKVDEILREMEENNVELDSVTVNKALRVYAFVSDIETMDKFRAGFEANATLELLTTLDMAQAYLEKDFKGKAREMLRRTEEFKDPEYYEELLRLYGEAGRREDVYRIWDLYKETRKLDNEGFRALIGSLLKLGDIIGAEEIYYKEWECSGLEFDVRIATMLATGYREHGMAKKADKLMSKTMRNIELDRPITPLLEEWGKRGNQLNQVKPSDLRDLIKNLSDSNQFSKALEASSWMCEKRVLNLFPGDYAARLHLTDKVFGLEEAEKFFETSIPENMKDYSVYTTLLTSYTRSEATLKKAESTFVKMRYFGFLSKLSPFNKMISLYSELGKRIEVENLLKEMKENNIEPDSVTMNNVLRVNACVSAIESMDKYKSEWDDDVKNLKLEGKTMNAMAEAYEREGLTLKAIEITASKKQVYRLWSEYKKDNKGSNEGYLSVIRSLLRLDDVKGAEEVYKEWQPQGPEFEYGIPSLLMSRYCEEGDNEVKAEKVVESCRKKKKRMQSYMFKEFYYPWAACSVLALVPPGLTWIFQGDKFLGWLGSLLLILFIILDM